MTSIAAAKLGEIQAELEGTRLDLSAIITKHQLETSEERLEDHLLAGTVPIETCDGCGWWFRSDDLDFNSNTGRSNCGSCDQAAAA